MHFRNTALALAAATSAAAQRPADTSICDYYTKALLKNNTAENQYTLLTLVVNTAVIGNYTMPNVGIAVPGILAPGMYNGTSVNLLPYFNGELESTNRGGKAVSVNFLDGGGAEPVKMNKPANDSSSNQYFLLTHLYEFFGSLLGCSMYGMGAFPAYTARPSMYQVHSFMDLNPYQMGYFIQQVALSAASFGVAQDDLMAVGMALNKLFNYRCEPPMTAIAAQGPQLQSICTDGSCPLAENATCASYGAVVPPKNHTSGDASTAPGGVGGGNATTTMIMNGGATSTMSMTSSKASATAAATAGASSVGVGALAAAGAFALALL